MKYIVLSILCLVLTIQTSIAQKTYYFPDRNAQWGEKLPEDFRIDSEKLATAVAFAKENEYSGSRLIAL